MNEKTASAFINSLVKNLQVLCHSAVDFNQNIEVIGHLYLNIDSSKKINYIVNEKVCKNDNSSTMFVSNSFHAEDAKQKKQSEPPPPQPQAESPKRTHQERHSGHSEHRHSNSGNKDFNSHRPSVETSLQYQNRHKRSMSIDEAHCSAKLTKKDSNVNQHYNQTMFSPPHTSSSLNIKSEKPAVDLSLVKQEPGARKPDTPSTQCLYSSNNKSPYHSSHNQITPSFRQRSASSSSLHQQSPRIHEGDPGHILKSPTGPDLTSIMENTEIYPVGMLHISDSVRLPQQSNVLPSISTLTSSKFASPSISTASSLSTNPHVLTPRQKGQRTDLKLDDKINLIMAAMSPDKPKQSTLAAQYGVSQPTISYILQRKDQYLAEYRTFQNRYTTENNDTPLTFIDTNTLSLDTQFDFDNL